LGVTENGQVLGGEEHFDAARDAWLAADVAEALQREDHLVHGRRTELEMVLHVCLGRGTAVDAGIGVDEGQDPCLSVKLFADMAELGRSVDSLGRCEDNGSMRALPLCSKDFYIPGVSPAGF
jgi:hypothetical protein